MARLATFILAAVTTVVAADGQGQPGPPPPGSFSGAIYVTPTATPTGSPNSAVPAVCPANAPNSCINIGEPDWCCPSNFDCGWTSNNQVACCPNGSSCSGVVSGYGPPATTYYVSSSYGPHTTWVPSDTWVESTTWVPSTTTYYSASTWAATTVYPSVTTVYIPAGGGNPQPTATVYISTIAPNGETTVVPVPATVVTATTSRAGSGQGAIGNGGPGNGGDQVGGARKLVAELTARIALVGIGIVFGALFVL